MNVHEQFEEDLSLFALGELKGEQRLAMERHLAECADCRREVEQVWGDLALLALSANDPKPPERARERLMAAIASEPRRPQRVPWGAGNWWKALALGAAATAVVVIAFLAQQNANLRKRIGALQADSNAQQQQLVQAKELVASLTSAEAEHFLLSASKNPPQPQGKVIYVRSSGTLVFLADNMAPLPPQKTYELWLIPASGAPIPAGLFKPGPDRSATLIKPPLPAGIEAKAFAISVEPEAGSPAPTTQPIMVGAKG